MENKDGQKYPTPADIFRREIEWNRNSTNAIGLQLALATRLPFLFPTQAMRFHQYHLPVYPPPMPSTVRAQEPSPYMKMMEEVSYWVTTKRAPCLLNYDNVIKRQNEQAHCSKDALKTTPSVEVPHPKNKKRKLKLHDDSESSEKQQNIFFDKSLNKDEKANKSVTSDTLASNIDFKITSAVQTKPKRVKVQKKRKEILTKANKVCTSTPKVSNLRRSLRKAQQTNNSQLDESFEILNSCTIAGDQDKHETKLDSHKKMNLLENAKNETNGKYEDSSDVSGFTANYIRSTKVHSSKTAPKVQNKGSRNHAKLKKGVNDHANLIMCLNKPLNTGNATTVLNCSSASAQNLKNLLAVKQETTNDVDKSTSLLKLGNVKNNIELVPEKKVSRQRNIINYDTSFQSKSSNTSRYPKRQRKISVVDSEKDCYRVNTPEKALPKSCKTEGSKSERKENSVNILSRTRSGRAIGLDLDPEKSDCSRVNINSSAQMSSSVTLNVGRRKTRRNNSRTKCLRNKSCKDIVKKDSLSDESEKNVVGEASCVQLRSTRSTRHVKKVNNDTLLQKESLKDKSGFAICFSDSDSDNEPLKQKTFFC